MHDAIFHQRMTTELELLRDAFMSKDTTSTDVKRYNAVPISKSVSVHQLSSSYRLFAINCEKVNQQQMFSLMQQDPFCAIFLTNERSCFIHYPLLIYVESVRPVEPLFKLPEC